MKFLFPYMARWKAVNWTRYHQIFSILADMGHEVHVIQAPTQNSQETNFQEVSVDLPQNLYLHEINIPSSFWNKRFVLDKLVKKGYYSFKCIAKVKEIIRVHSIDVLFLYNIPQYPLLFVNPCFKVFDFADDYSAMLKQELGRFNNPLAIALGERLITAMVNKSDVTFAVSRVLSNSIRGKQAYVVPNGVVLDEASEGLGKEIRDPLKKPIVGFIGSFEYFIDFDLILSAARRHREMTFLLVGSGREYDRVKDIVARDRLTNVVLTGGVSHRDVFKYIDAMDVCLNIFKKIPISHGACPIKLFEYLSMKKPVISTRLEELQYIDPGVLLYADGDSEFDHALEYIRNPDAGLGVLITKGYALVKDKYQWKTIARNLVEIIETKMLEKRNGICV